jgi:hypothetical protein
MRARFLCLVGLVIGLVTALWSAPASASPPPAAGQEPQASIHDALRALRDRLMVAVN